jgi:hypothetical protein
MRRSLCQWALDDSTRRLRLWRLHGAEKRKQRAVQEALALWQGQGPCESYQDSESQEQIEFWDADEFETVDTYRGKIRVIRAIVTIADQAPSTWCFAIIGQRARRMSRRTGLKIGRARWHLENTGFHQFVRYWDLNLFSATRTMLCWPCCCFGCSPSICCSCSFIVA